MPLPPKVECFRLSLPQLREQNQQHTTMSDSVTTAGDKSRDDVAPAALHVEKSSRVAEQGLAATDEYAIASIPERNKLRIDEKRLQPCAPIVNSGETKLTILFRFGRPLVEIDPKAEAKLKLKIDLYVLPTVALLYLFCFIDRANIGTSPFPPFVRPPEKIFIRLTKFVGRERSSSRLRKGSQSQG